MLLQDNEIDGEFRNDIRAFVGDILRDDETTIGLLRYGAHIPHIYQTPESFGMKPVNLLLSHMVEFWPQSFFEGRRFLLLDDTMYRGVSMTAAKRQLIDRCRVPAQNIRTATLVVHDECPKGLWPDHFRHHLDHYDYVCWKEELTALVRNDIRPTERDHPLYYFRTRLAVADLVALFSDAGHLQTAPIDTSTAPFKFTVTTSTSPLRDVATLAGITLDEPCKIRFYCSFSSTDCLITAVPIVPTTLDVETFMANSARTFMSLLKGPPDFLHDVLATESVGDPRRAVYYFVSRGIAALLLERLLLHARGLRGNGRIHLEPVEPETVDGLVRYVFPPCYVAFHQCVFGLLANALKTAQEANDSPAGRSYDFAPPTHVERTSRPADALLADSTWLLNALARRGSWLEWTGSSWEAIYEHMPRVTHHDLVEEFGDAAFISVAADELLDYGFLRAKDFSANGNNYARVLLPGGEYKSIEIMRMAAAWNTRAMQFQRTGEGIS